MAITQPGSGPNLVKDAHTHAIAATATWKAYVAGIQSVISRTADQRARAIAEEHRRTDYARGILGGHGSK